jgi:hypothetical protein
MTNDHVATARGNGAVSARDGETPSNLIGDVTWCRGTVTGKSGFDGQALVEIELSAVNQRQETTASGTATVALPRRSG